ncbi:hypothetical protein [Amycolatopsis sp. NPDC051716]|uniref:hypothetical protein n=1 Tax=Amycolatopsis sp. NPDC051716 TaxID=3155804 RepID=UPI00343618C7
MNAKPTRTQVAAAVLGACSVGAQVAAGGNGGLTLWQVIWMLAAMCTFGAGMLGSVDAGLKKRMVSRLNGKPGFKKSDQIGTVPISPGLD